MADAASTSGTAYANLDWTKYTRYRPVYPPSLRELIYKYHTRRSPSRDASDRFDSLIDVGGGIGISSIPYIGDFGTVHLLDPSPLNHEKAQVYLAEYIAAQKVSTKLDFTVGKAEDYVGNGPEQAGIGASLAICATTAHFIDSAKLINALYSMTRPGGTIAIYSYWNPVFPGVDRALQVALAKAYISAMKLCITNETTRALFTETAAQLCAGTAVLDSIGVPEDLFQDIWRIQINPQAAAAMDTYRSQPPVPYTPQASQAGQHETKLDYVDGKDPEAEGWTKVVDLDWLHGTIGTIIPAGIELSKEQYEELYGELDRVFAKECPSGSVTAMWGVNMILATKQ